MPERWQTAGDDESHVLIEDADEMEGGTWFVSTLEVNDGYGVAMVLLERHELLEMATWLINRYNETGEENE